MDSLCRRPIFQQKYEKFVAAFAKEYDNPDIVDFIDGHSLGWWGEGSHIKYLNSDKKKETFDWFTTMYSKNFKNIILVLPYNSEIGFNTEKRNRYRPKRVWIAQRRSGKYVVY